MFNSIFNSNNKTNYSTSSYYNQKIINNLIFSNNQLKQSENDNRLSPSVIKPPVYGTAKYNRNYWSPKSGRYRTYDEQIQYEKSGLVDRDLNKFPYTL